MAEFLNPHDPIVENFGAASSAMLMHLENIENGMGELDERLDLLAVDIPSAAPERIAPLKRHLDSMVSPIESHIKQMLIHVATCRRIVSTIKELK